MSYAPKLYILLALIYTLPYLQSVSMGVVSSALVAELHFSAKELGIIGSGYQYGYALVQVMAGLLAARFGTRGILGLFLCCTALGCVVFAWGQGLLSIVLGRILCGMGMAVVLACALTLFVRWFDARHYGPLCGWFFCCGGLGGVLGTAPLAFATASLGWRAVFLGLGAVTTLAALLCLLLVREAPAKAQPAAGGVSTRMSFDHLRRSLWLVAHNGDFWRLCAWFFCISGMYYGFFALWGGPYLTQVHGLTQGQVGGILSMGALGFVLGSPVYTRIFERTVALCRWGLVVSCVLALVCVCVLLLLPSGVPLWALYVLALALGTAANAPNAIAYAIARERFGPALAGSIGGILGFCSFAGGGVLQGVSGLLLAQGRADHMPEQSAFALAFAPYGVLALLALGLCLGIGRKLNDSGGMLLVDA